MTLNTAEFQQTSVYPMESFRNTYKLAGGNQAGVFQPWVATTNGTRVVSVGVGQALIDAGPLGGKGYYLVENASATTVTVSPAHATLPRLDQIYVRVTDTALGGGSDVATLEVIDGTPTAGATLSNRTGATALPAGSLRLFDVLVPAAATGLAATDVRDKQIHTRGSLRQVHVAGNVVNTSAVSPQSAPVTPTAANTSRLAHVGRVQSSGNPLHITYSGSASATVIGAGVSFPQSLQLVGLYSTDSLTASGGTWLPMESRLGYGLIFYGLNEVQSFLYEISWLPPAAGDYLIGLGVYLMGSQGIAPVTNIASGGTPSVQLTIEEMIQPASTNRIN